MMDTVNAHLDPAPHVVVDGGQSACRIAVIEAGVPTRRGTGPGFSYHDGDVHTAIIDAVLAGTTSLAPPPAAVDTVCLGLTGVPAEGGERRRLADELGHRLGARRVLLTGDAVTAYAGALGLGTGAVVVAGTGAITLAVGPTGETAQVDGWGYMLGDAGGGYWIGREGLSRALRTLDGRDDASTLASLARRRFGPLENLAHRLSAQRDRVSRIASFAEDLATAARRGDPAAAAIWSRAAEELAFSVETAIRRAAPVGVVEVSWAGRLFHARDLLLTPFVETLADRCPNVRVVEPRGTGLDGARHLAEADDLSMFASLITEVIVGSEGPP